MTYECLSMVDCARQIEVSSYNGNGLPFVKNEIIWSGLFNATHIIKLHSNLLHHYTLAYLFRVQISYPGWVSDLDP